MVGSHDCHLWYFFCHCKFVSQLDDTQTGHCRTDTAKHVPCRPHSHWLPDPSYASTSDSSEAHRCWFLTVWFWFKNHSSLLARSSIHVSCLWNKSSGWVNKPRERVGQKWCRAKLTVCLRFLIYKRQIKGKTWIHEQRSITNVYASIQDTRAHWKWCEGLIATKLNTYRRFWT